MHLLYSDETRTRSEIAGRLLVWSVTVGSCSRFSFCMAVFFMFLCCGKVGMSFGSQATTEIKLIN